VHDDLDAIIEDWLTLPDVAERLGIDVLRARALVRERAIVGVRRGERSTFQVPSAFLVTGADGRAEVLAPARGTITVLADQGFSDDEILRWLFTVEDSMGMAPIEALRAGRRAEVRRVAQALGF
jgi:hypothetical protein